MYGVSFDIKKGALKATLFQNVSLNETLLNFLPSRKTFNEQGWLRIS